MNQNKESILDFLRELKYSYKEIPDIFTKGSCFRLYSMLSCFFLEAEPFYSIIDGHWVTRINGLFYDINGIVCSKYAAEKHYFFVEDKTTLESAYVGTYKGQSISYKKYIETV